MKRLSSPEAPWRAHQLATVLMALGALFLVGCGSTSSRPESAPELTLLDMELVGSSLREQHYLLRIAVTNPSRATIEVRGLSYRLDLNDERFAKGRSRQIFSIPASGEKRIVLGVSGDTRTLLRHLRTLRKQADKRLRYRLSGELGVVNGDGDVPFSHIGEVELEPALRRRARKLIAIGWRAPATTAGMVRNRSI